MLVLRVLRLQRLLLTFCHRAAQAWWSLAWLKAYELTKEPLYLRQAHAIYEYLRNNSWDASACGGGCWWSSSKTYKNSITNALWLALTGAIHATSLEPAAARQLADLSGGRPFESLSLARESWAWIERSQLRRGAEGLFLDGLSSTQCNASYGNDPDANVTWTCAIKIRPTARASSDEACCCGFCADNQGVMLGGIGQLYSLTRNETLLDVADSIFEALRRTQTPPLLSPGRA